MRVCDVSIILNLLPKAVIVIVAALRSMDMRWPKCICRIRAMLMVIVCLLTNEQMQPVDWLHYVWSYVRLSIPTTSMMRSLSYCWVSCIRVVTSNGSRTGSIILPSSGIAIVASAQSHS